MEEAPIIAEWTPLDADAEMARVADVSELDALLDRIDTATPHGEPQAVTLAMTGSDAGARLIIVIGGDASSVSWYGPDGREHTSRGAGTGREPWFSVVFGGEWSDLEDRSVVSTALAREAAAEFATTAGNRPSNIVWDTELAQR